MQLPRVPLKLLATFLDRFCNDVCAKYMIPPSDKPLLKLYYCNPTWEHPTREPKILSESVEKAMDHFMQALQSLIVTKCVQ